MRNLRRFWSLALTTLVIASAAIAVAETPAAAIPADGPLDPAQDHFSRDSGVAPTGRLEATTTANRVAHAVAQRVAPRWVTIMGNVTNAGSYELTAETISLSELLARAGGPGETSNHIIQIVRDGRPWRRIESPATPLKANDLVIVQNLESPVASDEVTLGLIGLTAAPVAVSVGAENATINGILKLAHQTHLTAEMIMVLVDGARKIPLNGATRLPSCAVLVFDPTTIHHDQLPPLPTKRFPSASRDHILLANQVHDNHSHATMADIPASAGHVTITRAVPAPEENLSPLPPVQPLGPPPLDDALPRTADASGAVPIGPPEIDSHIVRYPSGEFRAPAATRLAAAPDPPPRNIEPIGLPVEEPAAEDSSSKDANDSNLWLIVLIAMLLGGGTFFLLRRLHGKNRLAAALEKLRQLNLSRVSRHTPDEPKSHDQPPATIKIQTQSPVAPAPARNATSELAPADLLSALVANRLSFREEPVELPRALFMQGRSTAPARRRVDTGNRPAKIPHIFENSQTPPAHTADDETAADMIFDPAEPLSGLALAERSGTPFEQALAKLRGSHEFK